MLSRPGIIHFTSHFCYIMSSTSPLNATELFEDILLEASAGIILSESTLSLHAGSWGDARSSLCAESFASWGAGVYRPQSYYGVFTAPYL